MPSHTLEHAIICWLDSLLDFKPRRIPGDTKDPTKRYLAKGFLVFKLMLSTSEMKEFRKCQFWISQTSNCEVSALTESQKSVASADVYRCSGLKGLRFV